MLVRWGQAVSHSLRPQTHFAESLQTRVVNIIIIIIIIIIIVIISQNVVFIFIKHPLP